jgi:RimJ/RimL family protein N-acetyltransferase
MSFCIFSDVFWILLSPDDDGRGPYKTVLNTPIMTTTHWIKHPTVLMGERVTLVPLERTHFDEICLLAEDKSIWKYSVMEVDGSDRNELLKSLNNKLVKRESGDFYPFVILSKETNKMVGNTMFFDINKTNRSLEIGTTWLHPDYWGTGINTECKYLMLEYCFEELKTIRVQIKSVHDNLRSRGAIEKAGFTFEGILRNDKILTDGSYRTAAYYSIIEGEWDKVKRAFKQKLKKGL